MAALELHITGRSYITLLCKMSDTLAITEGKHRTGTLHIIRFLKMAYMITGSSTCKTFFINITEILQLVIECESSAECC